MSSDEQVLVIPTAVLNRVGRFHGLCRDVARYEPLLLDSANFAFVRRADAEQDTSLKQLIPYVVLRHGDLVFHYTRGKGAGEQRLRALRSIGVGGHINPIDHAADEHPYRQGMLRELTEEVEIATAYRESCLGFINDDSTPVGQVHLGIVHLLELESPAVKRREIDIADAGFAPIAELWQNRERFETWSQFVLEELLRTARA